MSSLIKTLLVSAIALTSLNAFASEFIAFAGKENAINLPSCHGIAWLNNGGAGDEVNLVVSSDRCDTLKITSVNDKNINPIKEYPIQCGNKGCNGSFSVTKYISKRTVTSKVTFIASGPRGAKDNFRADLAKGWDGTTAVVDRQTGAVSSGNHGSTTVVTGSGW